MMFGSRKTPPAPLDIPSASLEDRFAKRAMHALLINRRVGVGSLDMDLVNISNEAYRIARFMLQARASIKS